jgi:hypothetical protein
MRLLASRLHPALADGGEDAVEMTMPLEFQTAQISRGAGTGAPGPIPGRLQFSRPVRTAQVVLASVEVGFQNQDRLVYKVLAKIENVQVANPASPVVTFDVYIGIRDVSGNWDDAHEGVVRVVGIADTV